MIRLIRDRSKIPTAFRNPELIKKNQALLDAKAAGITLNALYWKGRDHWKKAKPSLRDESFGKCAYCDSPADAVAHCDVEHFRPKSTYWWLAYCYDNYLYACQICNQTFKGDEFPVAAPRVPDPPLTTPPSSLTPDPALATSAANFAAAMAVEQAGLLNPCFDDPERYLAWEADEDLGEVHVRPADPSTEFHFQSIEKHYGLNREELVRRRFEVYQPASVFRQIIDDPAVPASKRQLAERQLRVMAAPKAAYAGMVRYFLGQWGIVV